MRTRTIKFIQFHNTTETRSGDDPDIFKMYPLCSESDSRDFCEITEDDNGDDYEDNVDYDCVSYYWNINDYYRDDNLEYMKSRRLNYSIIELEVNCDENDKPIWNVA